MDKGLRGKILTELKRRCAPGVRLPEGFLFSEENGVLTMTFLSKRGFGWDDNPWNMQDNSAAFEGWALVLYVHYLGGTGKIRLELCEDMPQPEDRLYTEYPHYSRFLYRALRFSRQYQWFQLSGCLERLVKHFDQYLKRGHFTNNVPCGKAGVKKKLESTVNVMRLSPTPAKNKAPPPDYKTGWGHLI